MAGKASSAPNPRRVAAGKRNILKRKGLTAEGRERLRAAALEHEPWRHSTGPRTAEGKARAAANGRLGQEGEKSIRQWRLERTAYMGLVRAMAATRNGLAGGRSRGS